MNRVKSHIDQFYIYFIYFFFQIHIFKILSTLFYFFVHVVEAKIVKKKKLYINLYFECVCVCVFRRFVD